MKYLYLGLVFDVARNMPAFSEESLFQKISCDGANTFKKSLAVPTYQYHVHDTDRPNAVCGTDKLDSLSLQLAMPDSPSVMPINCGSLDFSKINKKCYAILPRIFNSSPTEDNVQEKGIRLELDECWAKPNSKSKDKVEQIELAECGIGLAKELDDESVKQHPIACEDQNIQPINLSAGDSLELSLEETSAGRSGSGFTVSAKESYHVDSNKKLTSSSKESRHAKRRKKKSKHTHFVCVPKLRKPTKKTPRNTPQSTGNKCYAGKCCQNANNQIASTTASRNCIIVKTVVTKNDGDGCGGGGDSDERWNKKKKLPDDYKSESVCDDAEMPTDNSKSVSMGSSMCSDQVNMPIIAQESSHDESGSAQVDNATHTQEQVSEEAIENVKEHVKMQTLIAFAELPRQYQMFTEKVRQMVIHSAYCHAKECPQGKCCFQMKTEWIPHFLDPQLIHGITNPCPLCKCLYIALYMHNLRCQDAGRCDVWKCDEIKQTIRKAAKKREFGKGTVLYSTTSIWKEGQVVSEDENYAFLVKKRIGHGANGDVHRAWLYDFQTSCEADIALKEARYNLKNEANIVKILGNNHPCILQTQAIISLDNRGNSGYVIMELCECSLLDYLYDYINSNNTQGLPLADAIYFFVQVVDGVAYMHSKKIVHKDLKAKNIFLTHHCQRIKIGDWDASIFLKDEMTGANLYPKGTPGYAAPEVLSRKPHGFAADIFSLGCCLLELLCGHQHGTTTASRKMEIELLATKDKELAMLVTQCLREDPQQRPTAKDILCHPAILKYLNGNIPVPPEAHRMAGKHITNHKLWYTKADALEFCYPAALRDKAPKFHGQTDNSVLDMMGELPKELPKMNGPKTSNWCNRQDTELQDGLVTMEIDET